MMSDLIIADNPHSYIDMEKLSVKELAKGKFLKDVNFLNHIGYFCHDPQKAKAIKDPQNFIENTKIDGERIDITYVVRPAAGLGYPSSTAFNICDFIDRVLANYGRPAMNPLPFDMTTLREFLGLKKSGQNNQIIKNALKQLRSTTIETTHFFLDRNKKWIETTYSIIDKLVFVGEDKENIKGGLIYLNPDIIKSFNNKNQIPVNYERYADLPSPTKVLYLKLFRSFSAARKTGKTSEAISVENDYSALCKTLGFTPKKYKSDVTRQLNPHLATLTDIKKLVKSWSIKKKKNKTGFKLKTSPGPGFDEDHDKFNQNVKQLELDFHKRDKKAIAEIEAVKYFHEKLFGITPDNDPAHISNKEMLFAKEVLKIFHGRKVYKFMDYAIQEAKKTEFPIKTFKGLEGFINAFKGIDIKTKKSKKITKAQEESQNREEEAKGLYSLFIDEMYNDYSETLKTKEREEHERAIHKKVVSSPFCNGKDKESPIYRGLKENTIREFTEAHLINEFDFRVFLKRQGKDYLLDIKFK